MPKTNMPSAWRKRLSPVNSRGERKPLVLMCAEDSGEPPSPYETVLRQGGWHVLTTRLFTNRLLLTALPEALNWQQSLLALPSPRAVAALARQSWFHEAASDLETIAPGPQTAQALNRIGVKVVWTAPNGFRRSTLPSSLTAKAIVYAGNAHLKRAEFGLALRPSDTFLPLYHRQPKAGPSWTTQQLRTIVQADNLTVLALSPNQRALFESRLHLLGRKRPNRMKLVAMSERSSTRFDAKFWNFTQFPAISNRDCLIACLKALAF